MKMPDNKIRSVCAYFHLKLDDLYSHNEVESFFWILLESELNMRKMDFMMNPELRMKESDLLRFIGFVKRLMKFEPVQYIAGETQFMGRPFTVSPSVLIPRPETEELVTWISQELKSVANPQIMDIGTGSGCIAISLKLELPSAVVTGIDIQPKALEMARKNALLNNVEVTFNERDALQLHVETSLFDVIVSNPPYVLNSEKEQMRANVLEFEPHTALFVDDSDPLLFYRSIATWAFMALKPGGKLFFEINERYASETENMLLQQGFVELDVRNDFFDKPRMIKAVRK